MYPKEMTFSSTRTDQQVRTRRRPTCIKSVLLHGASAEAGFRGQATSFTGLEPIESETCDGIFYNQEDMVAKLSNLKDVPCNATIAVVDPESDTGIYRVRVVDTYDGCGENNIVLSALSYADFGGYLSLERTSLDVEWYVDGEFE